LKKYLAVAIALVVSTQVLHAADAPDGVVANVGPAKVTSAQLQKALNEAYGLNFTLNLIQLEIARQNAINQNVTVTPADVEKEREQTVEKMFEQSNEKLVDKASAARAKGDEKKAKEIEVPTITLNDLLDSEGVKKIDFLSIDIELWEPKALAGFDVERFRPELVCIEAHPQVRQQILDYFARHHYTLVGKYLRADVNNLYFAPLS